MINPMCINSLVLAYLGDTIYEDYIRRYLVRRGINNVNELQNKAVFYTSAKRQAYYLDILIDNNFLDEFEIDIVKRARNCKSKNHPKNTDVVTYRNATGLEALIGYLDFCNNKDRIDAIMNYIIELGVNDDSIR